MKKQYITPAISVIYLVNLEVISTSGPNMTNKPADSSQQWSKRREGIWDEDE